MKRIGLVDVDGHAKKKKWGATVYPNLALCKISAWHKAQGDEVVWYEPMFTGHCDKVYISKVFNFTPDVDFFIDADDIIKGGTGYDVASALPAEIDMMQPDYSIYPLLPKDTAYGFLTRGCPNRCKWCVVPIKEGKQRPYMDVEEIAIEGRKNLILMNNNVLASDYGLEQIEQIIKNGYRVDFNQALDARLVTEDIAKMLAQVRWISVIRFGCDTPKQIAECNRAMQMIDKHRKNPAFYLLYTMIGDDINEDYARLSAFRDNKRVRIVAQPYRDFNNPNQIIPQWQKDMARWAMRREIYATCDFKDYEPRKGFKCKEYFR